MRTSILTTNKRTLSLAIATILALLVFVPGSVSAAASSSQTCLSRTAANATITIGDTRATAHFTLPKDCKNQVVSFVSYTAPNGTDHKPFSEQKLYKATTRTFNISGKRTISVAVPDCFFQVDLVRGEPIESFANGRTYSSEGRMLTASGGGNKSCNQPAAAPAASTNQVTIVNNEVRTDVEVNNPKKVVKAPAQPQQTQPATQNNGKLPDTGPGELAALSFGTSTTAALLFAYRRRLDEMIAAIISRI